MCRLRNTTRFLLALKLAKTSCIKLNVSANTMMLEHSLAGCGFNNHEDPNSDVYKSIEVN